MLAKLLLVAAVAIIMASADDDVTEEEDAPYLTFQPKHGRIVWLKDNEPTVLKCTYNTTLAETDDEVSIKWTFLEGVHESQYNKHDEEIRQAVVEGAGDGTPIVGTGLISLADDNATSVLTLQNDSLRGEYICRANGGESTRFAVNYYFRLERVPRSYTVMNGDDLLLPCKLKASAITGRGNPVYHWYTKAGSLNHATDEEGNGDELVPNTTVASGLEPHIKFLNSSTSTSVTVKIENAEYDDRLWYRCVVTNDFGQTDIADSLVRVKYRYGALYPFLGIVAEVVVLCLVIFICERRRSSKEDVGGAEEDELNRPASGGGGGQGNSNVRQRVR